MHSLSLGSYEVAKLSFQLAERSVKQRHNTEDLKKVFVSGLARSGTTILTTYLAKIDNFFFLTYQDMPFPLMPNIWRRYNQSKHAAVEKERKHGDGIKISYQSVEEIEEYFWKAFSNDGYIADETLNIYTIDKETIQKFNSYINLVLNCYNALCQRGVYLSKNNNHIIRLKSLHEQLPEAYFIIPFRNPVAHAYSLLTQHNKFCTIQKEDPFVLKYMNWLGHYEFGLNHKYFDLGNGKLNQQLESLNKTDLNYWLNIWLNFYLYMQEFFDKDRIIFFSYEKFCENPKESIQRLGRSIGFETHIQPEPFLPKDFLPDNTLDKTTLQSCEELHQKMTESCVN